MVPHYLIIEEQRRRECERNEAPRQIRIQPPAPPEHWVDTQHHDEPTNDDSTRKRGAFIIDLNTFETTRL